MDIYTRIEESLKEFLLQYEFTVDEMGASPRSIGDKVQQVIMENFPAICKEAARRLKTQVKYKAEISRRAFEDAAFSIGDKYFAFDVKTRNVEVGFHMPNIKSVERLVHFYTSDTNTLAIISVDYRLALENRTKPINFERIIVVPIEQISWDCLRFGKLGYGQIQVEPNQLIIVDRKQSRERWMKLLFTNLLLFYQDELRKSEAMVRWAEDCEKLCSQGRTQDLPRLGRYIRENK